MPTKTTMTNAIAFVLRQVRTSPICGAIELDETGDSTFNNVCVGHGTDYVLFRVTRSFRVEVSISVNFVIRRDSIVPRVSVAMGSINCAVPETMACLALLQEMTMFAATLQTQLNSMTIEDL